MLDTTTIDTLLDEYQRRAQHAIEMDDILKRQLHATHDAIRRRDEIWNVINALRQAGYLTIERAKEADRIYTTTLTAP